MKFWNTLILLMGFAGPVIMGLDLHPGFNLTHLRPGLGTPEEFQPVGVGGMAFLPSGDLVICTWGGSQRSQGELWRISGVTGTGKTVTTQKLASGMREPLGLRLVGGVLYILEKPRIIKVIDKTGTGRYTGEVTLETLYGNWAYDDKAYHDFSFGFVYKDSAFYFNTGIFPPRTNGPERGAVLKVNLRTRTHAPFAGGMRNANGMALGPEGEIFSTDNQGHWLPANKLVNQRFGRQYGHNKGDNAFQAQPESPPVAWIQEGEVGNSPSEPLWMKYGPFAGQFLYGDVRHGGIKRVFVERVKGEYQGVVFKFIEPYALECGPNRLEAGPDSALYIGGAGGGVRELGGAGNWQWNQKWTGLQKIKANGKTPFEMKAIRTKADGFEIEFTRPAAGSAGDKANYRVDRWGFKPQEAYGAGNKENARQAVVQNVSLSPDGRFALVAITGSDLEHDAALTLKSTLFKFTLANIKAADGVEPLLHHLAWYTLNNRGPADALGCLDRTDPRYDAKARYDDGLQCANSGTPSQAVDRTSVPGIRIREGHVLIHRTGDHEILVLDMQGGVVSRTRHQGITDFPLTGSLRRGVHCVVVKTAKGAWIQRHLVL